MFGIRYVKVSPTTFVQQYRDGKIVREGVGLSFFYTSLSTNLVAVPIETSDAPFIVNEVTADFQEVTIQGQATYRIEDAAKTAKLIDFSLAANGRGYASEDPQKLPQRVINVVKVLIRQQIQRLPLREALQATDTLVSTVSAALTTAPELAELGIRVLGLAILAIKPTPETARALEAKARELLLKEADSAIHARRVSAVEQERVIKESELSTEIAVENKKRQVREAQMDAEASVQERQHQLQRAEIESRIALEERKRALVALEVENTRLESDAKAYALSGVIKAVAGTDPRILQALASINMQPNQLIAAAFQGLAERADRIGELNISPELLRELLPPGRGE
ncbi:MAG: SPFH domain-containing protein [Planctomycetes bacterium]|nr:SPFH domain-containing protein [Planctomycetota bacterium]